MFSLMIALQMAETLNFLSFGKEKNKTCYKSIKISDLKTYKCEIVVKPRIQIISEYFLYLHSDDLEIWRSIALNLATA